LPGFDLVDGGLSVLSPALCQPHHPARRSPSIEEWRAEADDRTRVLQVISERLLVPARHSSAHRKRGIFHDRAENIEAMGKLSQYLPVNPRYAPSRLQIQDGDVFFGGAGPDSFGDDMRCLIQRNGSRL
jgi:hypothetical protein